MKRVLVVILAVLLLIIQFGCAKNSKDFETPVMFYYRSDSQTHITPPPVFTAEIRETANLNDNYLAILNLYLKGPVSGECRSPFPAGVTAQGIIQNGTCITVTMSDTFASLSGVDLTIACSGIYLTLSPLLNCDEVVIQCENALLDGLASVSVDSKGFILTDLPGESDVP